MATAASVAELADAPGLGPGLERGGSSSLPARTGPTQLPAPPPAGRTPPPFWKEARILAAPGPAPPRGGAPPRPPPSPHQTPRHPRATLPRPPSPSPPPPPPPPPRPPGTAPGASLPPRPVLPPPRRRPPAPAQPLRPRGQGRRRRRPPPSRPTTVAGSLGEGKLEGRCTAAVEITMTPVRSSSAACAGVNGEWSRRRAPVPLREAKRRAAISRRGAAGRPLARLESARSAPSPTACADR